MSRNYRIVTFPSGLSCLLINDPSSHLFSAAVAVQGGHMLDPIDIPGLAHLCEHLVVGTENASLHSEVTNAGGSLMAFTSSDQTCFGFEISTYANLKGAKLECFAIESSLKKFSDYFTLKKFDLGLVSHEMLSVHDEHMGNTTQVTKTLWQGLKILASSSHPFSRFTTGSLQTLTNQTLKTLKSKVRDIYRQNYIPRNMSLVLKGPQTLNHLRKLAVTYFRPLENPGSPARKLSILSSLVPKTIIDKKFQMHSTDPDIFQDLESNILWIKADFEPRLRLCFPMRFGTYCVSEPVQRQFCNLLGCESPDSWCYFLKSRMQFLCDVVVSVEELACALSVLICDLKMTKKGMRNLLSVIGLLFFFIEERILKSPEESLCELLDNFGRVEDILFLRSTSLHSSLDEVSEIASRMNKADTINKDLIRGYSQWSPGESSCREVCLALRKVFLRSKVKVEILDRSFTNVTTFLPKIDLMCQQKCPYYGFDYMKFDYNFEPNITQFQSFESIKRYKPKLSIGSLSSQNPDGFPVKHRDFDISLNEPTLKVKENHLELWLHPIIGENQVLASINIRFPQISCDKAHLVCVEMFTSILGESLKYKLFHLDLFDCNWGVFPNVNGQPSFQFSYKGDQQYFVEFLNTALSDLKLLFIHANTLTYENLRRARVSLRQLFVNYNESQGFEKMEVMTHQLLEGGYVPIEERIEELEMIDVESLVQIGHRLYESFSYSTVLVSGRTEGTDILKLSAVFDSFKVPKDDTICTVDPPLSRVLPPGAQYIFNVKEIKNDPSSIVYYYIQMGSRQDNTLYTACKLLQFFISSNSFDGLRTQRSLGYSILSGMKLFQNTFGLFICVPAVQKDCHTLIAQIEDFLDDLEAELISYDCVEWESLKTRFLTSLDSVDEDSELPSSLFASLMPLVSSSGFTTFGSNFKNHWCSLNQILNGTRNFGGTLCEEPVNKNLILGLSHGSICKLFKNKLSTRSNHKSILVITKPAGAISVEVKISALASTYATMLARSGLIFTVEEVTSCLKKCSDKEKFSDLNKHLKSLLVRPSQQMKFHKFNMYHKLSEFLASKNENQRESKRSSAEPKEVFSEVKDIRQRCLISHYMKMDDKNDEQVSVFYLEDVLNYYHSDPSPSTL